MLKQVFISLRPRQWLKNFFVLAPLVFARGFGEPERVLAAVEAFALFCAASSAVYLVNDILDRDLDRLHPRKANRPVASGRLSVVHAALFAFVLGAAALTGGFLQNTLFGFSIAGYLLLQLLYSFVLKRLIILDVFSVAAGFVLRVAAGAAAISVPVSVWIVLCTFFLTLFLAVNKRRGEHSRAYGVSARPSLGAYPSGVLELMSTVGLSATVITYALYSFSSEHSRLLMLTVPIVLYGLFYYAAAIARGGDDSPDPTDVLLREAPLKWSVALFLAAALSVLLFAR
ncbi:MAG: decaprenyl-phosphate phosphoribosyltransferase [Patescibacteria group bacterium]